jgi:hypothetical protein
MRVAGSADSDHRAPWRVFVSHTSELRDFPAGQSYVAAVERAIAAAGHVVVDMADFPASDQVPADLCRERVRGCEVYVGVLGTQYGSPVRDEPEVSYTELEFDTATEAGLPRLVFLLDTDAADVGIPLSGLLDRDYGSRQDAFRDRVQHSGLITQSFTDPATLRQLVERSLRELVAPDPPMRERAPICYVSMPFGVRPGRDGVAIDFDALYAQAILPVAEGLGFAVRRSDALATRGIIQKAIFEAVLGADFMIADISLASANVIYELGIRHTAHPSGTVVISCGDSVPFDIQPTNVLQYPLPTGHRNDPSISELSTALDHALRSAAEGRTDSPVHELFPTLSVSLPSTIPWRGPANFLRMRLFDAQRLPAPDALAEIRSVEEAIYREASQDRSLLEDLMLAYREVGAWDDMVRVANSFPPDLRNEPGVVQQLALALNRSGRREAAESELAALIERTGGDSETYGLLGRILKDRWRETGERRELNRAIDAYRRGYELNRTDYYPGINLATLLSVRGDAPAHAELQHLVPELRRLLDDRATSGQADYWQLATGLELAVLADDYPAAEHLVRQTLARAAAPWMLESTAGNLEFIAEVRGGDVPPPLQLIIDRLRAPQMIGDRP